MKVRLIYIAVLLALLPALGACGESAGSVTSTRVPGFVPTAKPSNGDVSCNVLIPAAQQTAVVAPMAPPTLPTVELAPDYAEVRTKLDEFAAQFAEDLLEEK